MHFLPLINLIKQKTQPFLVKTKQERESQSPLRNILDEMTGQYASKVAFLVFHFVICSMLFSRLINALVLVDKSGYSLGQKIM